MADPEPSRREFAIRLRSIDELFWEFDARPVAERSVTGDVLWALLDEWERVRGDRPSTLTVYAPAAERSDTDERAVAGAIRSTLRSGSGPLRRLDPLSRQEKVTASLGIAFGFSRSWSRRPSTVPARTCWPRAYPRASCWWDGWRSGHRPRAS